MNIDLTSALAEFFSIFNTVINWLASQEFYFGVVHTNLFELSISIMAVEIVWFFFVSGLFD